jgi:hypothetical protein
VTDVFSPGTLVQVKDDDGAVHKLDRVWEIVSLTDGVADLVSVEEVLGMGPLQSHHPVERLEVLND